MYQKFQSRKEAQFNGVSKTCKMDESEENENDNKTLEMQPNM